MQIIEQFNIKMKLNQIQKYLRFVKKYFQSNKLF